MDVFGPLSIALVLVCVARSEFTLAQQSAIDAVLSVPEAALSRISDPRSDITCPPLPLSGDVRLSKPWILEGPCDVTSQPSRVHLVRCPPGQPALIVRKGNVTIANVVFTDCIGAPSIIEMNCTTCSLVMSNITLKDNSAEHLVTAQGGVVEDINVPVDDVRSLVMNQTSGRYNAALDITQGALVKLELNKVIMINNILTREAISVMGVAMSMTGCLISNNTPGNVTDEQQALMDTMSSSLNLTGVDISGNKGWHRILRVRHPLGASIFRNSSISNNAGQTLIQFEPRRFYINETDYRQRLAWVEGNGDMGSIDFKNTSGRVIGLNQIADQQEALRRFFWTSPLVLLRSNITFNNMSRALINATSAKYSEGYLDIDNTKVDGNQVGSADMGGATMDETYPPALLHVNFTEVVVHPNSSFSFNRVWGHLINCSDVQVTIRGAALLGNNITSGGDPKTSKLGQAINMFRATFSVKDTIFSNNSMAYGLIYIVKGNFSLNSSSLTHNQVNTSQERSLVYANNCRPVVVFRCTFLHNRVPTGAMVDLNYVNNMFPNENIFQYNIGSPLHVVVPYSNYEDHLLGVNSSVFHHNRLTLVKRGDKPLQTTAALAMYIKESFIVDFFNLSFVNNTPHQVSSDFNLQGGAMMVTYEERQKPARFTIRDSAFISNETPGSGGGVWAGRALDIHNCTFARNWAGLQGGGLYAEGPYLNVTACTFTSNWAEAGGGLVANPTNGGCPDDSVCGKVNISNSTFTDNVAQMNRTVGPGKALWVTTQLACSPGGGGAMCIHPFNTMFLSGVTMVNNTAKWGGGLFLHDSCQCKRSKGQGYCGDEGDNQGPSRDVRPAFEKCPNKWGLAYNFTVTNCTLINNTVKDGTGAAVFFTSARRLSLCCDGQGCQNSSVPVPCPNWRGNLRAEYVRDTLSQQPDTWAACPADNSTCGAMGSMPSKAQILSVGASSNAAYTTSIPDNFTLSYAVTLYDDYHQQMNVTPSSMYVQLVVRRADHSGALVDFVERPYTSSNLSLVMKLAMDAKNRIPVSLKMEGFDQDLLLPRPLAPLRAQDHLLEHLEEVRPCSLGEGKEGQGCQSCAGGLFSNHPAVRCEPCPMAGTCVQGVLVPREDFWHSSPYSPLLLQCPLSGACKNPSRSDNLRSFITEHNSNLTLQVSVLEVIQRYRASQCAPGYAGNLCSGCAEGYGRVGFRCMMCPTLWRNIIYCLLIFLFLCGQVVFVVVSHIKSINQEVLCPRAAGHTGWQPNCPTQTQSGIAIQQPEILSSSRESASESASARPAKKEDSLLLRRSPLLSRSPVVKESNATNDVSSPGPSLSRADPSWDHTCCMDPEDSQLVIITDMDAPDKVTARDQDRSVKQRGSVQSGPWKREKDEKDCTAPMQLEATRGQDPTVMTSFLISAVLKTLVTYVQMLSIVPRLQVSWPPRLRTFFQATSFSTPSEWVSLECLVGGPHGRREFFRTTMVVMVPVALVVVSTTGWTTIWYVQAYLDRRSQPAISRSTAYRKPPLISAWCYIYPRVVATTIQICFLVYPMVTGVVMEVFPCDTIDSVQHSTLMKQYFNQVTNITNPAGPNSTIWQGLGPQGQETEYWTRNYNISCSPGHAQRLLMYIIGIPALILFVLGFPLACMVIVYLCARGKSLEEPQVALKYGFLYMAYQEKYSYWENLVLLRKGMLLAASIFLAPYGPAVQLPTCIAILLLCLLGQEAVQPFKLSLLNRLERSSLFVVLLNFVLLTYFSSDEIPEGYRIALFVLVVVVTLMVLLQLIYHIFVAGITWLTLRFRLNDGNSTTVCSKARRVWSDMLGDCGGGGATKLGQPKQGCCL